MCGEGGRVSVFIVCCDHLEKNVIREVHVLSQSCYFVWRSVFSSLSVVTVWENAVKSDACLAAKLLLCGVVSAFIAVCCHWQEKYESDLCFAKKATTGLGVEVGTLYWLLLSPEENIS